MTNNIFVGYFIGGIGAALIMLAIFQIGLNIGIKTCISMLDGNYPAAMQFLNRNKKVGKILPYVISQGE